MVALGQGHNVLQRAATLGVAVGNGHVGRTGVHANHLGIDGLAFGSVLADVGLDSKQVVAFGQRNGLAKGDDHVGSGCGLAHLGVALPERQAADVSLRAFQVQRHAVQRQCVQVTLGLHVDGEQVLTGSTDGGISRAGLTDLNGDNGHGLRLVFADGSLPAVTSIIR